MSFTRVWGVFLRYFYTLGGLNQLADLFYWPLIDIFLWGITTVWMQGQNHVSNLPLMILTGLIFWQIIWRGKYEIAVNLLQEFWNRNLVNLFATPLKLGEWILGITLLGFLKVAISVSFATLAVYILYTLNVFSVGWAFLPYAVSLIFFGWMLGFLASGFIIYWGQKIEMIAFMMAYLFAPFSAVFYPVSALPAWAQKIAWALPSTYIFEGMRKVLNEKVFSYEYLFASLGLNLLYSIAAVCFFKFMYEKSRVKGLGRLE